MHKPSLPPIVLTPPGREDIRFRREILIQAQQVVQQIDLLEDQLEQFHGMDLPAFEAWSKENLSVENARLEALEHEYALAVQFHNSMVAMAKLRRVGMPRAFEMMREEQAAYVAGSPALRMKIEEDRLRRDEYIRADLAETAAAALSTQAETGAPAHEPPASIESEQSKLVYRKLVRRLHPDAQGPHAEPGELRWQKRIWDLAHAARQRGDGGELETLYKVTLLRQMDFAELTVAHAHDVYNWLRSEFERINAAAWTAQQNSAWGFSRQQDLRHLATRLRDGLRGEISALQEDLQELRGQHAYLEVISYTPRPQRKRARAKKDDRQLSLF